LSRVINSAEARVRRPAPGYWPAPVWFRQGKGQPCLRAYANREIRADTIRHARLWWSKAGPRAHQARTHRLRGRLRCF